MKTLKLKFSTWKMLALCLLLIGLQSCNQELESIPEDVVEEQTQLLQPEYTTHSLKSNDAVLQSLKASEDVRHYNPKVSGELLWDMATMVTYNSKEALPLIFVPIDNGQEGTISMFVAAYNKKKATFHSYLNSMEAPSENLKEDESYSGKIEFKTLDNATALKVVYAQGRLVEKSMPELSAANYKAVDTQCFLSCLGNRAFPSLVTGMGVVCANAGICCSGAPAPINPCCAAFGVCALAYGGIAGYCAWECWY